MTFWQCYYHVTWATQYRQPLLNEVYQQIVAATLDAKSHEMKCHVLEMYCMPDHVHVAVNIPPSVAVAVYVKQVKGVSAHRINQFYPDADTIFRWQEGYGVVTFGKKHLPYVRGYIQNQEQHHKNASTQTRLEST